MANAIQARNCCKCKELKSITCFGACRTRKDKLYPVCKLCRTIARRAARVDPERKASINEYFRAYRAANPDAAKVRDARHRAKNLTVMNARSAAWRAKHPERQRAAEIAYRVNNPDKRKVSCQTWRLANPKKEKECRARYASEHLPELCARSAKRRAQIRKALPVWADINKIVEIYRRAREATLSTGLSHHVDHIVPLQSKRVCGLHCEANLQIIPGQENLKKNNSWWPDMW